MVVTARNDNHGENLLRRSETFVNALIAQGGRHLLPLELVLVEWNSPPENTPLVEVLHWPADLGRCVVRMVTVPAQVHGCYQHAEALPLYQMIAKNAGIRRARGQFILATNLDILFSDELFALLAQRRLGKAEPARV